MEKDLLSHKEFKLSNTDNLAWNIVDGATYQSVIKEVFGKVAERISFTFGPYGNRTMLDSSGMTIMTKDGHNVLKNISYSNPVYNSVVRLLLSVCVPVVVNVGDGSSTCVISANKLYNHLSNSKILKKMRGKDLMTLISKVISDVNQEVLKMSTKIDENGDLEEIRKVALISTDNNDIFADMIHDIYAKTKNPTIEYMKSKSTATEYEIIEGFAGFGVYLDRMYRTSDDDRCDVKTPYIICFDCKIDTNDFALYIQPAIRLAQNEGNRLVVFAPYYDEVLLKKIRNEANMEYQARGTTQTIYCRAPYSSADMADNYRDFAMMCGCEIIREDSFEEFAPLVNEETKEPMAPKRDISELIGSVTKMTITDTKTTVSGFISRNESLYTLYMDDAADKYNQSRKDCEATGILTNNLFSSKKRHSRLTGRIGIIRIGGQNLMEKEANYDAVEDAIKACESAYLYGFNIGGSLSIPIACEQLMETSTDENYTEALNCIAEAMKDVFKEVLVKYYTEPEEEAIMNGIIEKCVQEKICYNLITKEYSMDVINPCMTDIEVLRGTASLCSVLLTSNQYLALMPKEEIM